MSMSDSQQPLILNPIKRYNRYIDSQSVLLNCYDIFAIAFNKQVMHKSWVIIRWKHPDRQTRWQTIRDYKFIYLETSLVIPFDG